MGEIYTERKRKMYRLCIFDLDGTLLNTINALTYTTNVTLSALGLGPVSYTHLDVYKRQLLRRKDVNSWRKKIF